MEKGAWDAHRSLWGQELDCGTVESLRRYFTNMYHTKVPSGDPVISQEIREAKMVWLQIQAKSECLIGSSEESVLESKEEDDKEEDLSFNSKVNIIMEEMPSFK
eukprot:15300233-Ditylum_brightwellii.AAC.1